MRRHQDNFSAGGTFLLLLLLLNALVVREGYVSGAGWYKAALVTLPLLILALFVFRKKQS